MGRNRNRNKKRKFDENLHSTAISDGSMSTSGTGKLFSEHGCPVCDKIVGENGDSIECHDCKAWVHFACSDLTRAQFDMLSNASEAMQFLCKGCRELGKAGTAGAVGGSMVTKIDFMLRKLTAMESKINSLEGCTGKKLEDKIEEVVDKKLAAALDERDEIDKRKNNVIVFGFGESMGETDATKMRYDLERIRSMIEKFDSSLTNINIRDPVRIPTNEKSKPRLFKFKVDSEDIRDKIVKGSIRANQSVKQEERVYFNIDFTPQQREKHKVLKAKLEEKKRVTGEKDWVIKRGEIVKQVKSKNNGHGQGHSDSRVQNGTKVSYDRQQNGNNQREERKTGNGSQPPSPARSNHGAENGGAH